jgi:hypothetical protein
MGLDHGKFSIDTAEVIEEKVQPKIPVDKSNGELPFVMKSRTQSNFTFEDIGSFSMEWPFVSFADCQGDVFVANAFDK